MRQAQQVKILSLLCLLVLLSWWKVTTAKLPYSYIYSTSTLNEHLSLSVHFQFIDFSEVEYCLILPCRKLQSSWLQNKIYIVFFFFFWLVILFNYIIQSWAVLSLNSIIAPGTMKKLEQPTQYLRGLQTVILLFTSLRLIHSFPLI